MDIEYIKQHRRLTLEYGRGETYRSNKPTLYGHSTYGRNSVLAGRPRRVFLESWDDLDTARAELKAAKVRYADLCGTGGSTHIPVLRVNDEIRVSVSLCRHLNTGAGYSRWMIMLDQAKRADLTIAARLASTNNGIRDYYLLPSIDVATGKLRLAETNGISLDGYRFDDLSHFFRLAERAKVGRDS